MADPDDPIIELQKAAPTARRAEAFATTHWTLVLTAASGEAVQSQAALETLCQRYWLPIYAFVRRRGHGVPESEDLTQGFFAHLLRPGGLKKARPAKGSFRSFLLGALVNFLAHPRQKNTGSGQGNTSKIIPLHEAEILYHRNAVELATPEKLFDQRWAWLLVKGALDQLREECRCDEKTVFFSRLEPALTGEMNPGWHAAVAVDLTMSEGAVRVALHRLRRRFGEHLRQAIAQTVSSPAEVDAEIRELFGSIAN